MERNLEVKLLLIGSNGYVGSFLESKLHNDPDIQLSTCDSSPAAKENTTYKSSYTAIDLKEVLRFDVILFFAGTSSVQQAMANPIEALNNNTFELFEFAKRLSSEQLFIYASSGSVYSNLHDHGEPHLSGEGDQLRDPTNVYDASKMIFDNLVKFLDIRSVGLRMGTVSGFSPVMRNDLVFNAMNLSARNEGNVFLRNADSFRTLLFLEDLLGLIQSLIRSSSPIPKIVNVGSLTTTIDSLAQSVAMSWGVPVISLEDNGGYNFKLDLRLMQNYFSPMKTSIQEEVINFRKMMDFE